MLGSASFQRGVRQSFRLPGVLILLGGLVVFVAGCPTEVPFQPPEDGAAPTSEAPAFSPDGTAVTTDEANEEPDPDEADPAEPPVDRYANPPETPPSRMPWETAEEGTDDGEVPDLFAQTDTAKPTGRYADSEPEEEPAEESYADFLGDAYAGLLDDEPTEEEPTEPTEPTEPEETEPEETAAEEPAPVAEPPAVAAAEGPSEPPFEIPPGVSFAPEDFVPKNETTATPKLPTTTKPADAAALDDLWADVTVPPIEPPPTTERPEPPPAVEPEVEDSTGLPFDASSEDDFFAEPTEPATEELPSPPEPAVVPEPEPEPPAAEPEPRRRPAPRPTQPRPTQPRPQAAPGVKPLPSVPVLPFNTRHLAWLLGGKLALAQLADLEGATPSEIADWNAEVERLARELKIRNPAASPRPTSPAARVKAMMDAASRAGGELSRAYGPDHSALLEIAVKSNTLLIVAADRPDLAVPVAEAVRAASDEAMLPRFLWGESVKTLTNQPTSDETTDAVERLHQRVESFLR